MERIDRGLAGPGSLALAALPDPRPSLKGAAAPTLHVHSVG